MSATAASVIGLAAAPAFAATTWTVKPGGAMTGTAGTTTVTDTTAKASVTCTSSIATGKLKTGSHLAGAGIGTVTSLAFKDCMALGVTVSAKITGKMPLNAIKFTSTKVAKMTITKIHGSFSVSTLCSATIDGTSATAHNGTVSANFSNATDTLKVLTTGSTLKLYNVSGSGCSLGNIKNGDSINFTGSYKLKPKQTITSP